MLKKLLLLFAVGLDDLGTDVLEQEQIADSLVADPVEEEPETESTEGEEESTLEASQEDVDQEDADWLPEEQERVWPDEHLQRFAQGRYPALVKMWQDPNQPEDIRQQARQILHDKLNDSLEIRRLSQEGLEEEEVEEAPVTEQPTQRQLPTREQYFDGLRQQLRTRTDPQVAKDFFNGFNKIYGLSDQQQQAILKANPNAATEFTELFSLYGMNLINTFADQLIWQNLGPQLEQFFPGFQDMHGRSSNIMAWDRVRNQSEAYQKLPQYGTKEFSTKARSAATRYFGSDEDFENAQFTKNVNGQRVPCTPMENAQKKYGILAKIMSGQMVDPKLIRTAVQTGAKNQRRATLTRSAGKLGTGITRGQSARTDDGDDLFTEGLKLYQQEHGSL